MMECRYCGADAWLEFEYQNDHCSYYYYFCPFCDAECAVEEKTTDRDEHWFRWFEAGFSGDTEPSTSSASWETSGISVDRRAV